MPDSTVPASNGPPATPDQVSALAARAGWARQTLAALKSLTAAQREVIQLSYFEHLSQEAIAARLGVPPLMVRVTVASALQRIADSIERSTRIGLS